MPIPKNLKAIRERRFLTQTELAKLAGVHQVTVARLETGGNAELKTIRTLAKALGVEPQELVGD